MASTAAATFATIAVPMTSETVIASTAASMVPAAAVPALATAAATLAAPGIAAVAALATSTATTALATLQPPPRRPPPVPPMPVPPYAAMDPESAVGASNPDTIGASGCAADLSAIRARTCTTAFRSFGEIRWYLLGLHC